MTATVSTGDLWSLWGEAVSMASLHSVRTQGELGALMATEFGRLLPSTAFAMCLFGDRPGRGRVEFVGGTCPWQAHEQVDLASWPQPAEQILPVRYRTQEIGQFVIGRELEDAERALVAAMLSHFSVAVVNLTLNQESRQATEHYCASLQALEEGIVLFQEEDSEAVLARLLSLASTMMHATAGALYVLREIGNPTSGLELAQALGMPEPMLLEFCGVDGGAWPDPLLGQPTQMFVREGAEDGIAGLAPFCVPQILQNVVLLPLRYHGVEAGICVLFNSAIDPTHAREHLSRVESLGQLGAALLHRLQLEAIAASNKAIARELQIAETIQRRLIPTQPPATDEYEFAWRSLAAQHIGGDYLDVITSDLGDIFATVADVSGHGINSALLMSSFRSAYRGDAPWQEPCELAGSLNGEVVNEVGATGMFITAVQVRIERGTRQLTVASAGHNPVFHYHASTGEVTTIESHGPPLGFVEGATYEQETRSLGSGDLLLLYTDGVTEAANAEMDMYGEDRLSALLQRNAGSSCDDILKTIQADLAAFTGRDRYDDDVSILVIKAVEPKSKPQR